MEFAHPDRIALQRLRPIEKPVFSARYNDTALSQAIVRLKFMKGRNQQGGTGFFVNIPGARKKFILTAGHNLISEEPHTDMKVQLFNSEECIDIPNDDVRINPIYTATPGERSADHDYGVILLPEKVKPPGDFGFALPLSVGDRLDSHLSVTGYPATNSAAIETSSGSAVNPIMRPNQLEYMIETEGGFSGSPVWVGHKGHPTVVAIHNYGPKFKKPGYGSRGTRINLKSLCDIFEWTGVDTTDKILRSSSPKGPVEPPLRMAYSSEDKAFRLVVDEIDDPPNTMLMSIFPVYAAPSSEVASHPAFGFLQKDSDGNQLWVSWDPPTGASLVDDLRKALLGRIEIPGQAKGWEYQQGKQFAIVVPPSRPGTVNDGATSKPQELVVEHTRIASWQLKVPGEALDVLGYRQHLKGKPLKDAYNRWILEDLVLE